MTKRKAAEKTKRKAAEKRGSKEKKKTKRKEAENRGRKRKKKMEDKMLRLMKRGKNEAKLNNVVGWEMNEILIHNI